MNQRGAVTFDFHNTLANCDTWFQLEVRTLVSTYLRWDALRRATAVDEAELIAADARYRVLRTAIMDHGHEETAERCVALVLTDLGLSPDGDSITAGIAELMRGALDEATPVPGALETVRAIAARGVPLGIVSSAVYHPFLEWTLARFGIRDVFTDVTTSASAGYYKGRPELFWHASRQLGVEPDRVVHVGDSFKWDVGGARRAGMHAVWYRTGASRPEDEPATPDLTVDTLEGAALPILQILGDGDRR